MLLLVGSTAIVSLQSQLENTRLLTLVQGPAVDANRDLLQAMTDAQTGLNAYQVSGNRGLLEPYLGAQGRTMASLATLADKLALGSAGDEDEVARHKVLEDSQRLAVAKWWDDALRVEQALSRGERTDAILGRALFERFRAANTALEQHLTDERDESRLAARELLSRGRTVTIVTALASLVAMLVLGRRVARSISRPLTELRDAVVRQRKGESEVRAREDQGPTEVRSLAVSFNELSTQNSDLQQTHARALRGHQITSEIGRAVRQASDPQQALGVICSALGEGLGVDRVIANTLDRSRGVLLGAQWHRPDLPSVADLGELPNLGELAEELWLTHQSRTRDDIFEAELQGRDQVSIFWGATGARASIMVPIGFGDRLIGVIYVIMVSGPRAWAISETNVVQAVAGFAARAIVEAESQAHQSEYVHRIEDLDRQKSDFLGTVSHELRTPLTSISGYLELLREGDAGELTAQQHTMLEVIERNTVRLRSLIEDVMVLNRIEGVVSSESFVRVSIPALISRVAEELSLLARRSAIELEIDAGPGAAFVLGDTASLDRAVVNILSNAIKFSRPGGVVSIASTLDDEAGRVLITCQDHGVGIPSEDQAALFTRFFRASNVTNQSIPGTGLGLSIAKQIVEDHHAGRLRLISVEGEGTTVVIDLPLHEPPEMPTPQEIGNDSQSDDVLAIVPDLAH